MLELGVMGTATPASQVAECIGKYTPEIAHALRACRRRMRAFVPRGYELVYDNYNALGIGYGAGQKASDAILSIVAYPRWVTLFFLNGSKLKDPNSLLEGEGSRVRSIRLQSPEDLDRSDIKKLISQALSPFEGALSKCPRIKTVIKSIAAIQRPRRPPKGKSPMTNAKRQERASPLS
jgi:hypothetical protein